MKTRRPISRKTKMWQPFQMMNCVRPFQKKNCS